MQEQQHLGWKKKNKTKRLKLLNASKCVYKNIALGVFLKLLFSCQEKGIHVSWANTQCVLGLRMH